MAVENKYVDASIVAGKKAASAATGSGAEIVAFAVTFEVAAADDDGSVYRIIKGIPSSLIPYQVTVCCDAITGGTSYDIGIYKTDTGAVINKNVLMSAQTLATALTRATGHQLGLGNVNVDAAGRSLASLSAQTNPDEAYDLAVTANTVGTAAGTVTVIAEFLSV